MENVLDPNETVLWSGKPEKKALILPDFFGGTLMALFFLAVASVFLNVAVLMPAVILFPVAIALIVVPPIWQYRKTSQAEYLITNQRLIIKSGITKQDVWFSELDKIKDIKVKIGFTDKLLGTGKLYPITAIYPYEPKLRAYSQGGMNSIKGLQHCGTKI